MLLSDSSRTSGLVDALGHPLAQGLPDLFCGVTDEDYRADRFHEECGVCAFVVPFKHNETNIAAQLAIEALRRMQDRGADGAGVVSSDGTSLRLVKNLGTVSDVFPTPDISKELKGSISCGHTRYITSAAKLLTFEQQLYNTHPIQCDIEGIGPVTIAFNGNLDNCRELKETYGLTEWIEGVHSDTHVFLHLLKKFFTESSSHLEAVQKVCSVVRGAFNPVFTFTDRIIAHRDVTGVRPLWFAELKGGGAAVMSESYPLASIPHLVKREVNPGEIIEMRISGEVDFHQPEKPHKSNLCAVEVLYFSNPASMAHGRSFGSVRSWLGAALAEGYTVPDGVTKVIPIPDGGRFAAEGFAAYANSKVHCHSAFIKSRSALRSFLAPTQEAREWIAAAKQVLVEGIIDEGEPIIVVDDTIMRGTTLRVLIKILKAAGAGDIHVVIPAPEVRYICNLGVDLPSTADLFAVKLPTTHERNEFLGASSVTFLTLETFRRVLREKGITDEEIQDFCMGCMSGEYPLHPEDLARASKRIPLM